MKTVLIDRVKARKISSTKLELTLPDGMNGSQLQKWQSEHKEEVLKQLEEGEKTEEPVLYVQS